MIKYIDAPDNRIRYSFNEIRLRRGFYRYIVDGDNPGLIFSTGWDDRIPVLLIAHNGEGVMVGGVNYAPYNDEKYFKEVFPELPITITFS